MTRKTTIRLVSVLLCALSVALVLGVWQRKKIQAGGVRMVHAGEDLHRLLRERAASDEQIPRDVVPYEAGGEPLLVYFPLDPDHAGRLYPSLSREINVNKPRKVYCPLAHYANAPGWRAKMYWNEHPQFEWENYYSQAGFRNPYEPAETPPDVRILLTGDSHIEAVVPYEETVAALLEMGLRSLRGVESAEVLNGASGGYDFYNYLGTLQRNLHLRPDVFLVIVYGGNDFVGVLPLHAYFQRMRLDLSGPRWRKNMSKLDKEHAQAISQAFQQVIHFVDFPQNMELALTAGVLTMREMQRICDREGIAMLSAYVPAQHDVRPQDMRPALQHMMEVFGLDEREVRGSDRLADRFLAELRAHGIDMLDLRPAMRAAGERLFWDQDHHLNTRGQYIVAHELMPRLRPVLAERMAERRNAQAPSEAGVSR